MKIKFIFILPLIVTALMYFYSCDDAGVNQNLFHQGVVSFSVVNLKTLNSSVDGVYELWIVFDTTNGTYFRNMGSFNIGPSGEILDLTGNNKEFILDADTLLTNNAQYCFITIAGNGNPDMPRLIAGSFTHYEDSVTSNLVMNDPNAVGLAMEPVVNGSIVQYILNQPTDNNNNCKSGIWFCDTLGSSTFPNGMALNSNTSRWVYEGWIADTSNPSNPIYRSTGRFYDPYSTDMDGAGPCAGIGTPYTKPGQDWVTSGNGCPGAINLATGYYQVFVTIEPAIEGGSALANPFFLKIYLQSRIDHTLGCGRLDNVFGAANTWGTIPRGHIHITK
jgi:hypothetical protein